MRVFITQPSAAGLDPYTALKSTERIAVSLSELIYTTTFFDNALSRVSGLERGYIPDTERARRKWWRKTITTSIVPGTSLMTVTAFHVDPAQARLLAEAVAREIVAQVPNYFGYNIRAQIMDTPLDSRWFVRPYFFTNGFIGAALGALLGFIFVLLSQARKI